LNPRFAVALALGLLKLPWGTTTMLSVDQFLRLISVPAIVVYSVPDRVANLGRGDLSLRVSATGQRIACKSNCALRPFLTAGAFSEMAVASFCVGNVSEQDRRLAVHFSIATY
jgi:hypothetical protein